jgi:2-dehydropantoate 2-reductase
MDNIVMVGAGAMGCLFAARLALSGKAVTVVDVDPARLALISAEGIVLDDDSGHHVGRVRAARAQEVTGPVDLLMLFTKGMHSAAAIHSVAHLEGTGCAVLTLQNGLGNVEAIAEVFPAKRICWGVTDFPADLEGPNQVASHGQGHIFLGNWPQGADARAEAIADVLLAAGLNAVADADVPVAVWEKVAFNAALNALCTVSGLPVGALDHPAGRRAARAVIDEIFAIAAAEGIAIDRLRLDGKVDFAIANHTRHKPSMLQDRLAGRLTEIESINGALLAFAARHGVPAPALQLLTDLVRLGEGAA